MGLFTKNAANPLDEVKELKAQGLSDNQVIDELRSKGLSLSQINDALAQSVIAGPDVDPSQDLSHIEPEPMQQGAAPASPLDEDAQVSTSSASFPEELQGRIEEITETIIDEKWDLLIEEVKKVVEWKERVEEDMGTMRGDLAKLKEDFKDLHQGVLGKLEDYDTKMTEVGTELKAVGKVFKDVVPEFVENVKELKGITTKFKRN